MSYGHGRDVSGLLLSKVFESDLLLPFTYRPRRCTCYLRRLPSHFVGLLPDFLWRDSR